jgi:DNA-binding IclR family transcriptional regulator
VHQKNDSRSDQEDLNNAAPRIGTVAATIAILRLLASERQPLGVNAIARRLSQTPSSCFNILKTLCSEQVLEFDDSNKTYLLASGMIGIARRALDPESTFELIRSRVEMLAETWSLTVGLWREVKHQRIILVGYAVGAVTMRIHLTVGQRLPLLMGSTGRCIAAHEGWSAEAIARDYPALHWQRPLPLETYLAQVEEARLTGWGLDEGWFIRGATSLAVPIPNEAGAAEYCLSATMFNTQHAPDQYPILGAEMLDIARWASNVLGGRSDRAGLTPFGLDAAD